MGYEKQVRNLQRIKKKITKKLQFFLHHRIFLVKITTLIFFLYLVCQIQKQFIVMIMVIIQFIKVIDTGLIIQMKNGIKKKLSIF